jgi:glycerol-3-phosphate cytidylyltransferase
MNKIAVIGAGQFGTAVSNCLLSNKENEVKLFSSNKNKVKDINNNNKNSLVYPNFTLNSSLTAELNLTKIGEYKIIFLAIPSFEISEFIVNNKKYISDDTLIINLAKGLISEDKTIVEYISDELPFCDISTMKGPTFAIELLNKANSIFTFGYSSTKSYKKICTITANTGIYLDFSNDVVGVEYLSVLKNIYAILIGYIDAKYNSSNTRFLVLTKSFREIKILLKELGGDTETVDLACGFGDLGLTALNDLSRNRTLGLMMGKGFVIPDSNNIVLEGLKAITMVSKFIPQKILDRLPLFFRIKEAFEEKNGIIDINFDDFIMQGEKRVITYGTFDLLHYGHLEILSRAKNLGTELIVGLSTDEFNEIKGKKSVHDFEKRKEFLESLSYVSKVIPEYDWNQKEKDVLENNIDLFVMGDDWKGKFDFLKKYCEVDYLSRTKGISTTLLKKNLL